MKLDSFNMVPYANRLVFNHTPPASFNVQNYHSYHQGMVETIQDLSAAFDRLARFPHIQSQDETDLASVAQIKLAELFTALVMPNFLQAEIDRLDDYSQKLMAIRKEFTDYQDKILTERAQIERNLQDAYGKSEKYTMTAEDLANRSDGIRRLESLYDKYNGQFYAMREPKIGGVNLTNLVHDIDSVIRTVEDEAEILKMALREAEEGLHDKQMTLLRLLGLDSLVEPEPYFNIKTESKPTKAESKPTKAESKPARAKRVSAKN